MARRTAPPRTIPHPEADEMSLQKVLESLADPVRRSILRQLADTPDDLCCSAFDLPVAISTATHHFNVLRETGLVRQYYTGTLKMNTLRTDDIEARFPGLLDVILAAARTEPPGRAKA